MCRRLNDSSSVIVVVESGVCQVSRSAQFLPCQRCQCRHQGGSHQTLRTPQVSTSTRIILYVLPLASINRCNFTCEYGETHTLCYSYGLLAVVDLEHRRTLAAHPTGSSVVMKYSPSKGGK